jgi:hypothetical protein
MSKLIDAATAKFTGIEKPKLVNNLIVDFSERISDDRANNLHEYHIKATYVNSGFCQRNELPAVMENFVKGFKRDVYDSIINDLFELEKAIYSQDLEAAKSRLRDIWTEVR